MADRNKRNEEGEGKKAKKGKHKKEDTNCCVKRGERKFDTCHLGWDPMVIHHGSSLKGKKGKERKTSSSDRELRFSIVSPQLNSFLYRLCLFCAREFYIYKMEGEKKNADAAIWEKIRSLLSKCDKKKWDTRFAPVHNDPSSPLSSPYPLLS
jgi:hypothetical protein